MKEGMKYFAFSCLIMGLYAGVTPRYPTTAIATKEFGNYSMLYKLYYLNVSLFLARLKYYSGWILSYAMCIFNGISYTETEEEDKETKQTKVLQTFEKGDYGSLVVSEFGHNAKYKIMYWNRTVHLWLKYNLYTRTINIEHKLLKNNFKMASF